MKTPDSRSQQRSLALQLDELDYRLTMATAVASLTIFLHFHKTTKTDDS